MKCEISKAFFEKEIVVKFKDADGNKVVAFVPSVFADRNYENYFLKVSILKRKAKKVLARLEDGFTNIGKIWVLKE